MAVRGSAEGGIEHILDLARPVLNGREPADHFVVLVVRQIVAGVENVAVALQHKPLGVSIVSVFTAYLCCEILNWVREIVSALTHSVLAGEISYAVLIVPVFLLLRRYFVRAAYEAMTCSKAALGLFGSLPVAFYFFDYATTIYSDALYAGIHAVNESLPALLIVFYVIFLTAYHVQTQRRGSAEMQSSMLEAKWSQAQTEMDAMRRSQAQTAVYQHDMRHHLNQISRLAEEENLPKLKEYLTSTICKIPDFDMHLCENQAADSVAGYYYALARRENIPFSLQLDLPARLPVDEVDMCLVLSNLLENALEASLRIVDRPRHIRITSYLHAGNLLLIQVENTYVGEILEKNGVFQSSKRKGEGIGLHSVRHIAEKSGGASTFSHQNGIFCAKVMLCGKSSA